MKLRNILVSTVLAVGCMLSAIAYATSPIPLGGSAFPLTYVTVPVTNLSDAFNEMLALINVQTVGISQQYPGTATEPTLGTDTSQTTFSLNLQGNPLMMMANGGFFTSSALGSINGGTPVLVSQTGRKIILGGGLTLMASGTAAGATSVVLECEPSGRLIGTWPIGTLINLTPVGIYASAASGVEPTVVLGSAMTYGCNASDAVFISANGTLTTTSLIFVNIPYTIQ